MSYECIEVRPVSGALGAEIHGVDLSEPLDNQIFDEIHRAFLDNLVIFFRDQEITPGQQLAFARRFGGIHLHPYMKGLDDQPEILEIVKEVDDAYNFGGTWHTDQMFAEKPALGTLLYAKEAPAAGGDTLFANMYLAYESLSDGMKEMLAGLKTLNVGDRNKRRGGRSRAQRYGGKSTMRQKVQKPVGVQTESAHPAVRTHPETARKSLYIGAHTQQMAGLTYEESLPLVEYLAQHAVRPEFTCRFRWEVGSLALWDNRCTQHHALNDYPGQRRRMHRITIAGDKPV